MPLTGRTEDEIRELERLVLGEIPAEGTIGNQSLREAVAFDNDDLYLAIRNRLRDDGRLVIGRGRGGSIRRVPQIEDATAGQAEEVEAEHYAAEADLYEPMRRVLRERWVQDQIFDSHVVEDTARGGARADGTWSRPDITCVSMTTFAYLPGKFLDVTTFEVKPRFAVKLTAVYEALAHRRAATRAYALFHVPEDELPDHAATLDGICEEAGRHGIGVIVAANPTDYDTWDFRVEADRVEPEPEKLNHFIRTQISEGSRDEILKWLR